MTPAQVAEFVAYDPATGVLSWKPRANRTFTTRYGGKPAFSPTNEGYLAGTVNGRAFKAHRVAWAIHYGQWPKGMVDHVNGDRTDNRVANLREVDRRGYDLSIDDFILEACMPEPMSGCWLWLMQVDRFGYGKVKYKGRTRYAHRAVYEHYHGEQPEDLVIRHRCDTPICVNPDHLCSGTHQDNMDDMVRRGRSKKCAHRTGGHNV